MVINYLAIGFFWSLFAVKRQQELYPTGPVWKVWICWILNLIGWPLGIIMVIIRRYNK